MSNQPHTHTHTQDPLMLALVIWSCFIALLIIGIVTWKWRKNRGIASRVFHIQASPTLEVFEHLGSTKILQDNGLERNLVITYVIDLQSFGEIGLNLTFRNSQQIRDAPMNSMGGLYLVGNRSMT